MSDTISRDDAIDRMKAGLPCETRLGRSEKWSPTNWTHFDCVNVKFRRPPEPRRLAREWWIQPLPDEPFDYAVRTQESGCIHVREVLPGDVTLQRMTVEQAAKDWHAWRRDCGWTDDMRHHAVWLASRCALGLIGEGS